MKCFANLNNQDVAIARIPVPSDRAGDDISIADVTW